MEKTATLLQQVTNLKLENRRLKELLQSNGINPNSAIPKSREMENCSTTLGSVQLIVSSQISNDNYRLFTSMFKGRSDVFSLRSAYPNPKTGKYGYYVQKNYASPNKANLPLTNRDLLNHLRGAKPDCSDVVGLYPVLPDETCYFLVFDFDDHSDENESKIRKEIDVLHRTCKENQISHLVERSRSGKGYHIWFFFEKAVPAYLAREFGTAILLKSSERANFTNFKTFDRMIPTSDHLPINHKTGKTGIGNMVALPLQGQALKKGNSSFIDDEWKPFSDQWQALRNTRKLSQDLLEQKIAEWGTLRRSNKNEDDAPWESKRAVFCPNDIDGLMQITISDRLYIDKDNIQPRLQNQLRRLAAFNNPDYYKKQAMGFSVLGIPRIVYSGEDISHFICLPRGLFETLTKQLDESKIKYEVNDRRNNGHKIKVVFNGKLYPEQKLAAEKMLKHDDGVLSAATAFGKTVLGAYLIAKRKVNTLILVHNYEIMKNWQHDLEQFLTIKHVIPEKLTPRGRKKKLKSIIGTFKSTSDSTTGIIDIAMISSLGKPGEVNNLIKEYGMVIMDECHHGPARVADGVLREINSKYLYGLTATASRADGLGKKIFMLLGPERHKYTAKDRARKTQFSYTVRLKSTAFSSDKKELYDINRALTTDDSRNNQIISDTIGYIDNGRTPIVVTKFKKHATFLYEKISQFCSNTFIMTGDNKNDNIRTQMRSVSPNEPLVLIATGQYVGEGFNFPRLDTLIMATPISFKSTIEQYAGRINRDYDGKKDVVIIDYIDKNVPMLMNMYRRRKTAYRAIGYSVEGEN